MNSSATIRAVDMKIFGRSGTVGRENCEADRRDSNRAFYEERRNERVELEG